MTLPEKLRKAEVSTQGVITKAIQDGEILAHDRIIFANVDCKRVGSWLPSELVASVWDEARKELKELVTKKIMGRIECNKRYGAVCCTPPKQIHDLIDAVLGRGGGK